MAGKRHRWGRPDYDAPDFKRWVCACGARRYWQSCVGWWFHVPAGGNRFTLVEGRTPPCPGRPEEKKP